MGEVYRAIDASTGMAVAIKRMLVEAYANDADESAVYQATRFEEECKLLKNLNVPGVPAFVDSFLDGDRRVIVMEFIEGLDLEKQVQDRISLTGTNIPPLQAVQYTIQVAKILEYLHAHRPRPIIHRDVKPANIIVRTLDNAIYLVDFGLAREVGGGASTKTAVGTVGYAPLEQYRGRPTTRTDQYSLGVTLHFMLSGQQPLPLQIEPLDKMDPPLDLPHELCWVVRKATQQDQDDRFESVYEFRRELEKLLPGLERHQKNLELQDSAQNRMALMGPTEELDSSNDDRPTQRVKIEGYHVEAKDPFENFGIEDPLKNSISVQTEFQRQAIQAEQTQRKGTIDLAPVDSGIHRTRIFTGLCLLLVGLVTLYLLNARQQRSFAGEILGPKLIVLEAHGLFHNRDSSGINRAYMGRLESILSLPQPRNDGLSATLGEGISKLHFRNANGTQPAHFLAAALGSDGRVIRSLWLRALGGRWMKAPSQYQGVSVDFQLEVDDKVNWESTPKAVLDCNKARTVVILVPPQKYPLVLEPIQISTGRL